MIPLNQKVVDKFFFFLFKVCAEVEGACQGAWSQRLLLSLSLPLFLPFSLFSPPSFFATLLFPLFLSLYPLALFFFPPLSLSLCISFSNFLSSFLNLAAFPDSFLLCSSLSLFSFFSIFRSFSIFFPFFFFIFFSIFFFFFFFFFFFHLSEAPLRGFSARSRLCILCIF